MAWTQLPICADFLSLSILVIYLFIYLFGAHGFLYLFTYLFILLLAEIELQHLTNFYLLRRRSHAKISIDVKNMKATEH